jgi:ankyrin repeat protein
MTASFSCLTLHYACANGASLDVLHLLVEAYPKSRSASDKRGCTPLHFAIGNNRHPASPAVVDCWSRTPDTIGSERQSKNNLM